MHSVNYYNTFIEIAPDSPTAKGEMPPLKGEKKTIANLQFELLYENPYKYTSDDVLFVVFAIRQKLQKQEHKELREQFFSKGRPCFRASPLTKKYGWGVHANEEGKIAIYGAETVEYNDFLKNDAIQKVKAMRTKRN